MILAGDIGGTSTRLGLFEVEAQKPILRLAEKFPSQDFPGLREMLKAFFAKHPARPEAACFGIAGPIRAGRVETPNLPWVIQASDLAAWLGGAHVWLINDLEAHAYGVATVEPGELLELNPKAAPDLEGNAAIIAAGTGLGEAGFYCDGKKLHPFAAEGGHATFSPRDDLQVGLLDYLAKKLDHVSVERVLSGPGQMHIYEFLRDSGFAPETPAVASEIANGHAAAAITRAGMDGTCRLCAKAVEMFVAIYGSEAGNLALKLKATRGVFVGGGIAPRILPKLREPLFLESFLDKGRMRALLDTIPLTVILNDDTGLAGAALCAALRTNQAEHPWIAA